MAPWSPADPRGVIPFWRGAGRGPGGAHQSLAKKVKVSGTCRCPDGVVEDDGDFAPSQKDEACRLEPSRPRKGLPMAVSLAKGGNVSLSKEAPGLTAVTVGLGWDVRTTTGTDHDLDASALLCNESGKVLSDSHFVFYNNLTSPDGSVQHTGDNLTGEGEGDDETINIDLTAVPGPVSKIVFPVSIHDAQARGQSFGQVRNAYIRVINQAGGAELA